MDYPRALNPNLKPFDPVEVARDTEKIAVRGNQRKYNLFRLEPFYNGIATARAVGCDLRCGFCWINPSRDFPENYGSFYSPSEVHSELIKITLQKLRRPFTGFARISGAEPTLGREHLLSLISECRDKGYFNRFLLETNGILLGDDENYVKELKGFGNYVLVRLSFKAGTPEAFEKKTGAKAEFFDLPFIALYYLRKYNIPYRLAAMSIDPAIIPSDERRSLLKKIASYGEDNLTLLEEERADPFGITIERLTQSKIVDLSKLRQREYLPINVLQVSDLSMLIFDTKLSPCVTCYKQNPWHGHRTRDDLDPILE